ncbi:hypothetical protein EJ02DRAFT_92753 [Clathrospora elynae]|uniref:tRNA/rRNA methyltransferase SpoU type domain-containing protein n=1 Tax=Clathrospora elynae TaxID=706981 RepID=A0A6A5TF92_9PLEO|nr:hypothetical protein EJ02DRAFT_92753 [Clathrospora elynae]
MATDAVLGFLDVDTKKAAFVSNLARLQAASQIDFDALEICIRLLPSSSPTASDASSDSQSKGSVESASHRHNRISAGDFSQFDSSVGSCSPLLSDDGTIFRYKSSVLNTPPPVSYTRITSHHESAASTLQHANDAASTSQHDGGEIAPLALDPEELPLEELWDAILQHVAAEKDPERLYRLADVCLGHGSFAAACLSTRVEMALDVLLEDISGDPERRSSTPDDYVEDCCTARAYLSFLKCSFWLPGEHHHMVNHDSISLIAGFIGIDDQLDDIAHDTLSAFFSLLKNNDIEKLTVAQPYKFKQLPGQYSLDLSPDRGLHKRKSVANETLWDHLNQLDLKYFISNSSKVFRTWFQWISQAASDGSKLECLAEDEYWSKLRLGLVNGYADQRKFCLGIIRQSLLATHQDIFTPTMVHVVRNTDRAAYEQYTTLFETIILHRYSGQVEAALPTLTTLLGTTPETIPSKITAAMAITLLAAAFDSKIQESIRKMIGYWYMDYVVKARGDINGHIHFLFEAFLPWAMEGSLFTSTLHATRAKTECTHGASVAAVIAKFVSDTEDDLSHVPSVRSAVDTKVDNRHGRAIVLGVVRFILNARGRIFQPALLYLMEGLIDGLRVRSKKTPLRQNLVSFEIAEILSLARLTGLPEVASDLHAVYCRKLCDLVVPELEVMNLPSDKALRVRFRKLEKPVDHSSLSGMFEEFGGDTPSLQPFLDELYATKHRCIQGPAYAPACKGFVKLLDQIAVASIDQDHLHIILTAFWEEAERRDFVRPVVVHLPALLFHPTCIQVCISHNCDTEVASEENLTVVLSNAMRRLQQLSKGRSYVLSVLARSLRKAAFLIPPIVTILPFEDLILDFVNDPPSIKSEFLFEVIAAEKLSQILPHRTYTSYYGQREWHAYAAMIDLLRRFPGDQLSVAKRVLDQLLEPWKSQQAPVPVKSPWKKTLQLQAMLLLQQFCITEAEADTYVDSFMHALVLESWPRYRYLLEWIVARIYYKFPGKTSRIIDELGRLEEYTPIHMASLMKLGLLVAPFESEAFAIDFATQLNCYSASPKVQIRHEANFAFPIIFELAITKDWRQIFGNPAFAAMNAFVRRLDKFNASPWTIRTLKLDIVQDFTLDGVFQGRYLSIESPEGERVRYEDFEALDADDSIAQAGLLTDRIQLGNKPEGDFAELMPAATPPAPPSPDEVTQNFLQTKAGIDLDALHPPSGSPSKENQRPASVMMVASLIDNPTNLGGLSRISESFGLEVMYIDDLKKTLHKDFKATSVRSEKHLQIQELKEKSVPEFLLRAKSRGYEVVGIEQTDRSGILGQETVAKEAAGEAESKTENGVKKAIGQQIGTLPKKCCLVMGSEKEGISAEVLAVIDRCVEIKTVGVTRSLNVQTAGGIAVYEWWREWGGKV